jgi:hypothetical protein
MVDKRKCPTAEMLLRTAAELEERIGRYLLEISSLLRIGNK